MGEEYAAWGKYEKYDGHINQEMLNKAYGNAGMFFETLTDAEKHKSVKGGVLYPIVNYYSSQVERNDGRVRIRDGAKPHVTGYLVSHPEKANGKVLYMKRN